MTIIEIKNVLTNNGIIFEETTVEKDGNNIDALMLGDGDIRPTIYPSRMSHIGEDDFMQIIEDALFSVPAIDKDVIGSKEYVLNNVIAVVVNKKNVSSDTVAFDYLDMVIVFRVIIDTNDKGMSSYLVKKGHLDMWDITAHDLYIAAKNNDNRKYTIQSMFDIIGKSIEEMFDAGASMDDCPMYVVSTESRLYGASAILNHNILNKVSSILDSDKVIIIPSSVDELLVIPYSDEVDPKMLVDLITMVNSTEVEPNKVLSNTPYMYSDKVVSVFE